MKIIFLDHQGVMYIQKHPNPGTLEIFDLENIKILNSILQKDSDIEIVISSDWKYWVTLEEMQMFYEKQGIVKKPIAYTPKTLVYSKNNYPKQRSVEIKNWLILNKVKKWVAIDDLNMCKYLDNFIWIDEPEKGLKQSGVTEKIIEALL